MKKTDWSIMIPCICMVILILDTKTALIGAADGIDLCLWTLIPSLFPFILLSKLLVTAMLGRKLPIVGCVGRLLRIPDGAESIFLVGLLGGYPIGAQCISQAVSQCQISKEAGERMLSFCSNAGPAFIFGIGIRLFDSKWMCWVLWIVHILSAIITAWLTKASSEHVTNWKPRKPISLTIALKASLQTMAIICGWVIVFRVILAFCQRWFLWAFPQWLRYLFAGFLELSNGSCELVQFSDIKLRFILFAAFLGFGGACVAMQTKSVCDGLHIQNYICGKICQTFISVLLASGIIYNQFRVPSLILLTGIFMLKHLLCKKLRKRVAFLRRQVYNEENLYVR